MIREPRGKTRAEVNFLSNIVNSKDLAETWCLLFMRDQLVRVTLGKCNLEELKAYNTYNRKLLNLLEDTNEVLLQRQVRRTGAKALHIFKNSNSNSKRSTTVYFKNEKDCINSTKFAVFYFNSRLSQAKEKDESGENKVIDVRKRKIPNGKEYKEKYNRGTRSPSPSSTESGEDEAYNTENSDKEYQWKGAYSKKKSKEIKEGKRRASFVEASSSTIISQKPNMSHENSMDYMLQLIRSLEEKIQNMEWDTLNRS